MKSVALFDFDNTLYRGFSYFALIEKQVGEGLVRQTVLDEAFELMSKHHDGAIDYETTISQLLDIYAHGLAGKQYTEVYASTREFYTGNPKVFPYAKPVFELLRATHDLYLVTGEPLFVAEAIAEIYSLSGYYGTHYQLADGAFTGEVVSYLASRHEKQRAIKHLLDDHAVANSLAFGDSEGDIEMLSSVAHPICVNPNAGLREHANKNNWPCVSEDKVEQSVREALSSLADE
ncbi:HAD-IB family hydrolase [Candidatus Saccharibacteria bacterium]|nr:HAD-IB family hydrolase [Candidatus Saccharibacteria bacterium]